MQALGSRSYAKNNLMNYRSACTAFSKLLRLTSYARRFGDLAAMFDCDCISIGLPFFRLSDAFSNLRMRLISK